ncbi:hypothetical protein [Sphingobium yanoikuyae]|uniref:hypothetical protein n=1 Tax=Sphingobium yanoikuyae TaxID=13690 RepID=UPI0008470D46|nr:hypothetical protein [Sphingobium yanoikuyae]
MTKIRPALSFGLALTKVAGVIGWHGCAKICRRSERTLRNWSDDEAEGGITLDKARTLDLAYRAAGGVGAPFLECYALSLETMSVQITACSQALSRAASDASKETGEAMAALIMAARPGATRRDREVARKELEEGISSLTGALAQLGTEEG